MKKELGEFSNIIGWLDRLEELSEFDPGMIGHPARMLRLNDVLNSISLGITSFIDKLLPKLKSLDSRDFNEGIAFMIETAQFGTTLDEIKASHEKARLEFEECHDDFCGGQDEVTASNRAIEQCLCETIVNVRRLIGHSRLLIGALLAVNDKFTRELMQLKFKIEVETE